MRFDGVTPERWKRIRAITSLILDDPSERDAILDRECRGDDDLRAAVVYLAGNYSETGALFGCEPLQLAPVVEPPVPGVRERIGPYRILREIGRGGMGAVYLAVRDDGAYTKQVAIKVLPYGGPGQQRLFLRERQILAALEHPNITRLLDGGAAEDGTPYLVMDYVDGTPLAAYLERRSVTEILRVFLQICGAIQYAHQNLIVHCDLKPGNILVTPDGVVKVLDFGIAKLMEANAGQTALTWAAMTPAYASPEQRAGRPVNTLSDVYSLGMILYLLLAGRLPFEHDAAEFETPPPSRWKSTLKGDLDSIVMKAMETEPRRRYASVEQFARDIQRYLDRKPVQARQGTWWYRAVRYTQRRTLQIATIAGFAIVLGLGATGTLSQKLLAERRFSEVRRLAQSVVFQYQDDLRYLPGSTALRARMATDAVRYLDHIAADAGQDENLESETALAYRKVGEVQGYGRFPNLGDVTGAAANLRKSADLFEKLSARHPSDPRPRLELAVSLERQANVLSLSGRNSEAKAAADRAIALLQRMDPAEAARETAATWRELSFIEERRGKNQAAIEAAHRAVEWAARLPESLREERSWAYERLAMAITVGMGPNQEALGAARTALDLYGPHGSACAGQPGCWIGYLTALEGLGAYHSYAGRYDEVLRIFHEGETEIQELVRRDPNDRMLLRQLCRIQHMEGHAYQSTRRIPQSLSKFRASIDTAIQIARSDPDHPEAPCQVVISRAKYAEVLVQSTDRVAEAGTELQAALKLADANGSDSLACLDYRKVTVINLARVAERQGDWAAGMEWRRETVRNALRYAAKTPGEPLGMVIEAGANFELGLGGLEAAQHGDRIERLREARRALKHALDIYGRLRDMGNPLENQYSGWPDRTQELLNMVEQRLGSDAGG